MDIHRWVLGEQTGLFKNVTSGLIECFSSLAEKTMFETKIKTKEYEGKKGNMEKVSGLSG